MAGCETLLSLLHDGTLLPATRDDPVIKIALPNDSPWAFEKLINWLAHGACSIGIFGYSRFENTLSILPAYLTAAEADLAFYAGMAWVCEGNRNFDRNNLPASVLATPSIVHEIFRHMVELYRLANDYDVPDLLETVSQNLRTQFYTGPKETLVLLERLGPILQDPREQDADAENRRLYEHIIASFTQHRDLIDSLEGLRDLEVTSDIRTRKLLHDCESAESVNYEWDTLSRAMESERLLVADKDVEGTRIWDGGSWNVRRGEFVILTGIDGGLFLGVNARGYLGKFDKREAFRRVSRGALV